VVKEKLTATANELPVIDKRIADLAGTMAALKDACDMSTRQLIDFISQL